MKIFCIVNGKQIQLNDSQRNISGYSFNSGMSHLDVLKDSKVRSITDLIIAGINFNMTEKEISNQFGIDLVSVNGKVKMVSNKSSSKDRFFELKNKKVILTDKGKDRFVEMFNRG